MADRFFCPDSPIDGRVHLVGDEARHLARVRRFEVGASVELFDGRGVAYRAEVAEIGRDRVGLAILSRQGTSAGPALVLTLASAVPKGDRFDWLVEKATEIGVARLIPLTTARSIVDPRLAKLDRLRRAVIEASKQSGRDLLMEIDRAADWSKLLASASADHRIIAHPGGVPIASIDEVRAGETAILAIGPEGGFADDEAERAIAAGWRMVSLGPTVLRVETAAVAASMVLLAMAEAGREGGDR